MEPTKHQYDYDAATVIGFLRHYGLDKDFKLNIEVNHAILAGHTFAHELQVAADAELLGSIDANKGDYQNGWDTDEFPTNIYEVAEAMLIILQSGGFKSGGINLMPVYAEIRQILRISLLLTLAVWILLQGHF